MGKISGFGLFISLLALFKKKLLKGAVVLYRKVLLKKLIMYKSRIHVFFIRKPFFCLSLNFLNIMLEIRLIFS